MKRVGVVGAGLFGCTAAIHLARAGHEVHLFERSGELLGAASGINHFRLHEGYHYPRSPETVAECIAGLASFRAEYGEAVIDVGRQHYAIAKEGSRTSAIGFLAFCARHGLHFEKVDADWFLDPTSIALAVRVREGRIDLHRLRNIVAWRLDDAGVHIHGRAADAALRDEFDRIVIAAYASTNEIGSELGASPEPFQFEVVEKLMLRLPDQFRDASVVVMDGEFCGIDPFGRTGLHVMGHVTRNIHATNTGFRAEVPKHLRDCLNCGMVVKPEHTRFREMVSDGQRFIPALAQAEHVGSMYTVRTVLPHRDHDDARPTLVTQLDEKVFRVFSGKLGTAVDAAREIVSMIGVEKREAA